MKITKRLFSLIFSVLIHTFASYLPVSAGGGLYVCRTARSPGTCGQAQAESLATDMAEGGKDERKRHSP